VSDNIGRDLGRIEGKLDAFMSTLKEHTDRMNRMDENHEQLADKVGDTTKKVYLITVVGGAIWAALIAFVSKLIHT
jgi:hypothetical protein